MEDGVKSLTKAFESIIDKRVKMPTGETLSIDGSIAHHKALMQVDLDDIRNGEWNGVKIKDSTKIPEHLGICLKPMLAMAVAISNTSDVRSQDIPYEHRKHFGQSEISPNKLRAEVVDGINTWLRAVRAMEDDGIIPRGVTGKPLWINCEARQTCEIERLSDVTRQTDHDGFVALAFVSDTDAMARRSKPQAGLTHPAR